MTAKRPRTKLAGYSLLELIVSLALTAVVMLGMIYIVTTLLRLQATTFNRAQLREDMVNFSLEFEKDLRNSSKVGLCDGYNESFYCVVLTDSYYLWTSCPKPPASMCTGTGADCVAPSPVPQGLALPPGNYNGLTMCKISLVNAVQNPSLDLSTLAGLQAVRVAAWQDTVTYPVLAILDNNYNLDRFGVTSALKGAQDGAAVLSPEAARRAVATTMVASHPNKRLNIRNILRQTVVSTKNFERVVRNTDPVVPPSPAPTVRPLPTLEPQPTPCIGICLPGGGATEAF